MAISLPSGITVTSKSPIDTRILLSKEEMRQVVKARMPEKYFAICKDDGLIYLYNENNDVIEETGRFRKLETGGMTPEQLAEQLPVALKEALAAQSDSDSGLSVDDNGNIKVSLNQDQLQIVDNKIELAFSLIQAIDGN